MSGVVVCNFLLSKELELHFMKGDIRIILGIRLVKGRGMLAWFLFNYTK